MFFLIGVWGGDRRKYAALKFIIFTFAGSAVMLVGFLALYFGVSPSTFDIPYLAGKVPAGIQYLPLLAVFVGCAVELPVFPFHSWQPDAYEQAPAPVNSLLSGILPKFAGYAVIRIAAGLFPQAAYQYAWAFIAVAILSMFYGAIVALLQSDLKRMFAYTSISHMGFVLFGTFATIASGNPLGIEGLADLCRPGLRYVNRQRGAGTRVLLDVMLGQLAISPAAVEGYAREEPTHLAVAAAIAAGRADTGMGIMAAARAFCLDFVPLAVEPYDLVVAPGAMNSPQLAPLWSLLQSDRFKASVEELGGYSTKDMGRRLR